MVDPDCEKQREKEAKERETDTTQSHKIGNRSVADFCVTASHYFVLRVFCNFCEFFSSSHTPVPLAPPGNTTMTVDVSLLVWLSVVLLLIKPRNAIRKRKGEFSDRDNAVCLKKKKIQRDISMLVHRLVGVKEDATASVLGLYSRSARVVRRNEGRRILPPCARMPASFGNGAKDTFQSDTRFFGRRILRFLRLCTRFPK